MGRKNIEIDMKNVVLCFFFVVVVLIILVVGGLVEMIDYCLVICCKGYLFYCVGSGIVD